MDFARLAILDGRRAIHKAERWPKHCLLKSRGGFPLPSSPALEGSVLTGAGFFYVCEAGSGGLICCLDCCLEEHETLKFGGGAPD